MEFEIIAESVPFGFYLIRTSVLKYLPAENLSPLNYKFIYPLEAIDRNQLSLTDRIDPDNQIRFYLRDRTFRIVSELAKKIAETGIREVCLPHCKISSQLMNCFCAALTRMHVNVKLISNIETKSSLLTANEITLIREIIKGKNGDLVVLQDAIKKIINTGDIFTAESILEHGLRNFIGFEQSNANMLGTVKNCVIKPLEAEYYYRLSKADQSPLSIVKAHYPLAMLYLRHHTSNKISLEKGKKIS